MISAVNPERAPGGYQAGGVPTNVPNGAPAFPGAVGFPNVSIPEIQKDTPGKRSNATVQYARTVALHSKEQQMETEDLERAGSLAMLIGYNPPGYLGADGYDSFGDASSVQAMIHALGIPASGGGGVNKLSRLCSYSYLTAYVPPTQATMPGIGEDQLKEYTKVFGSSPKQRITHMMNLATVHDGGMKYDKTGLNLNTLRESLREFIQKNYTFRNLLTNAKDVVNTTEGPQHSRLAASGLATGVFRNGFETDNLLDSPYLLPMGYINNAKGSQISTSEPFPAMGDPKMVVSQHLRTADHGGDGLSSEDAKSSYNDDARNLLYEALLYNPSGVFSPLGAGPWRPDGVVIYKYSTYGMDSEIERLLDSQQNALYNIAIGGQTILSQLSSVFTSRVESRSGQANTPYARANLKLKQNARMHTMPGDKVYLLVIGQVVKQDGFIVDGSEDKYKRTALEDDMSDQEKTKVADRTAHRKYVRLTNLRFELSNSQELSRASTPKGEFGFSKPIYVNLVDARHATPSGPFVFEEADVDDFVADFKKYFDEGAPVVFEDDAAFGRILAHVNDKGVDRFEAWIRKDNTYLHVTTPIMFYEEPKGTWKPITSMEKSQVDIDRARLHQMELKDEEVIVGGWELGVVIDSAASQAIIPGTKRPITEPGSFSINMIVQIRKVSGLTLHQRYWSRQGYDDM